MLEVSLRPRLLLLLLHNSNIDDNDGEMIMTMLNGK